MEIRKIYLDMDGVLANFDQGVIDLCGMEPPVQSETRQGIHDDDAMWEAIRDIDHFYDRLQTIPGAEDAFRKIYNKYQKRCEILTGVPKKWRGIVTASEDKIKWTRRILSDKVVIHAVNREEKKNYCTGKHDILIDDYDKNIKEWTQSGGTGILFTTWDNVLKELEKKESD